MIAIIVVMPSIMVVIAQRLPVSMNVSLEIVYFVIVFAGFVPVTFAVLMITPLS